MKEHISFWEEFLEFCNQKKWWIILPTAIMLILMGIMVWFDEPVSPYLDEYGRELVVKGE